MWKITFFWSEIGLGFENRAAHPHQEFLGVPPGEGTLITRRRQFRLTLIMYKLTHGLIDIDSRKYLIQHSESRTRGSHQLKFRVPYANKDGFKFSFFPKSIADWNCLPEAIVLSTSLETFKYRLSAFLK